jgi:hypothetical protein
MQQLVGETIGARSDEPIAHDVPPVLVLPFTDAQ